MYKHILIATDGSELASQAVVHGITLAKKHKAPVTVVTVTELWSAFDMARDSREGSRNPLGQYEAEAAASARRILDKAGQIATSQGVPCNLIHVPDQHPAEGIVATAKEKGCDLIVMASHGHRGIDRILLGSRAYEVLTYSKVPVLIVR
jgi:nucleotide-binding universal stress UspA family protein